MFDVNRKNTQERKRFVRRKNGRISIVASEFPSMQVNRHQCQYFPNTRPQNDVHCSELDNVHQDLLRKNYYSRDMILLQFVREKLRKFRRNTFPKRAFKAHKPYNFHSSVKATDSFESFYHEPQWRNRSFREHCIETTRKNSSSKYQSRKLTTIC
ncbi:hypothetical protein KDRO_A00470 [Kluyveromyces lactis]|nr:hypothetical protein KDRO_A00470 [Kluyveromyces lactis]